MRTIKRALIALLAACFLSCAVAGTLTLAYAEETSYYVCFSSQNYAIRNSNKLTEDEGNYILSNVTLSSAIDFYVTDGEGTRWYGADNKPVKVEETGLYRYDILFSPSTVYLDTGCKISYRFYEPAAFNVMIEGEQKALTYNPFHTGYDLYCLSSVYVSAGGTVSYESEEHTVRESGYYRILFTPERRVNGNDYMFDENGNYGSGEDFKYNVYVEDAPQYYAVFENVTIWGAEADGADASIEGKPARYMARFEDNVLAAEYRTPEFFAPERDYTVKYRMYEKTAGGAYVLIDDDNNGDTAFSKLTADDVGWYTLSTVDGGEYYASSLRGKERKFNCFYLASAENGYGFDGEGNVDLSDGFRFTQVEEGDDDYDDDYEQYVLYLTVTDAQLKNGDYEFYITDGKTKYADGREYISIGTAGRYKILFSEEHNYGRGRNFRYILEEENKDKRELLIGSADEFLKFAENCSVSADFSVNLIVYLTADIDFAGVTFKPVKSFSGTFNGGYHVLKNITYKESGKKAAVFETVNHDGIIERLKVENAELGGKDSDFVGFVGANYGKVRHVSVTGTLAGKNYVGGVVAYNGRSDTETGNSGDMINRATVENCSCAASVSGESYVGGVCGQNMGEIVSCTASGRVAGVKNRSTASVETVGGITGYSLGKIYGCDNSAEVTAGEGRYVGGIAGLCAGEVYFSFNRGAVSAQSYAGGIVGYYGMRQQNDDGLGWVAGGGQDGDAVGSVNIINYTANYGSVTADGYAGGIVGNVGGLSGNGSSVRKLKIYNSASSGDISVTAGNYAGGIVGSGTNAEIRSCAATGTVQAKGLGGGNYAGGVIGYGGGVYYSMSACTVKGENYLGGIAGYATSALIGCYTNVLLLPGDGAEDVGAIAGFAAAFNVASNKFDGVEGNYYVGAGGGIGGVDYEGEFGFAGARIDSDVLSAGGTLSPVLCEQFSREYWQSGNGNYPTLRSFEEAEKCDEFGDEQLWNGLFDNYADTFKALTEDAARLTFTVTFLEWNKDNGDLYDDGEILYDNFEIIYSVRVAKGQTAELPSPKFAKANADGRYIYEGGEARYFVSFPALSVVSGNTTVYAEYCEIATTVASADNTVLAEGEFYRGTVVELIRIGDYFTLRFVYGDSEINVGKITVKFYVGEGAEKYRVTSADGNKVNCAASGKYVSFEFSDGDYFSVSKSGGAIIPSWAWLLIGAGATALAAGGAVLAVYLVNKKRKSGAGD